MNQLANNGRFSVLIRMVHHLVLGVLLLFAGCDRVTDTLPVPSSSSSIDDMLVPAVDHNTLPIETFAETNGSLVTDAAALSEPSILVVSYSGAPRGERVYLMANLIIVNPLDQPIDYFGYRMNSFARKPPAGEILPIYVCKWTDPESLKLQQKSPFWCGTGAGMMSIPPKHAGRFRAEIEMPPTSLKIGLARCWNDPGGEWQHGVIWSEEIAPQQ